MCQSLWNKPAKLLCWLLVLLLLMGSFSGCRQEKVSRDGVSEKKLKIVATIYPLAEFSSRIVGDNASVTQLMPPGSEPHHWEPSPTDMKQIYDAQVFIYHGAGMEPWVEKILPALQERKIKIIKATEKTEMLTFAEEESLGVTKFLGSSSSGGEQIHEHNHGDEDGVDPHAWLDPLQAKSIVSYIAQEIAAVDTVHSDCYLRNAQAVLDELDQIHQEYSVAVSQFQRRDLVVSHAAFGYLANRYGLCQIPILGLTPEQEPDAATMAGVIDFTRKQNIKYIFFEAMVSPRVAETIARETGAKTLVLHPIGALTEEENKKGFDYFDLMHQNLENLKKALK